MVYFLLWVLHCGMYQRVFQQKKPHCLFFCLFFFSVSFLFVSRENVMKLLNSFVSCLSAFPQVLWRMAWRKRRRSASLRATSSWPKTSSRQRKTSLPSLNPRTWAVKTWSTSAAKVSAACVGSLRIIRLPLDRAECLRRGGSAPCARRQK